MTDTPAAVLSAPAAPQPSLRDRVHSLSPQQRKVVAMIAEGLEDKVIAEQLGLDYRTIKTHTHLARIKLGARNRTLVAVMYTRYTLAEEWLAA